MCKALAMSHKEESSLYLVAWTISTELGAIIQGRPCTGCKSETDRLCWGMAPWPARCKGAGRSIWQLAIALS
ncbi:hypothetical protein F2Q69_00054673 [Brassica cretica]|uniref:Uncharacterized protein n=1 Tax=Brassica cretica TaxID=69181 RepID=A0A8S9N3V1_BRACR|nr:hypothetical protein F2Q69_00054673 [Brassica cretica]